MLGGGRKARYLKHLPEDLQVESVNIDPVIEPTWLIEPGATFPVADGSFDNVICLNQPTLRCPLSFESMATQMIIFVPHPAGGRRPCVDAVSLAWSCNHLYGDAILQRAQ